MLYNYCTFPQILLKPNHSVVQQGNKAYQEIMCATVQFQAWRTDDQHTFSEFPAKPDLKQ